MWLTIGELVTKFEKAAEPDRELDVLAHVALFGGFDFNLGQASGNVGGIKYSTRGLNLKQFVEKHPKLFIEGAIFYNVPQLSSSLEACHKLQTAMFPSCMVSGHFAPTGGISRAQLVHVRGVAIGRECAARSPTLAWAAAILAAASIDEKAAHDRFKEKIDEAENALKAHGGSQVVLGGNRGVDPTV